MHPESLGFTPECHIICSSSMCAADMNFEDSHLQTVSNIEFSSIRRVCMSEVQSIPSSKSELQKTQKHLDNYMMFTLIKLFLKSSAVFKKKAKAKN